jgi:septum formation protein
LVLASASPARLATLAAAGITAEVRVSGVDEDAALAAAHARMGGRLGAADAVVVLARAKAEAVARELGPGDALVLGCDSLLELDGQTYGKPSSAADAVERWRRMRGSTGVLHTGHWLVDLRAAGAGTGAGASAGSGTGATSSTVVHFADLTDAEIDAYVATGEPLTVAGAFTVDGLGGPFVTRIEGDYHTVVGLSRPMLRDLLGEVGVSVPDLWR